MAEDCAVQVWQEQQDVEHTVYSLPEVHAKRKNRQTTAVGKAQATLTVLEALRQFCHAEHSVTRRGSDELGCNGDADECAPTSETTTKAAVDNNADYWRTRDGLFVPVRWNKTSRVATKIR
jgi:hypothetical protein